MFIAASLGLALGASAGSILSGEPAATPARGADAASLVYTGGRRLESSIDGELTRVATMLGGTLDMGFDRPDLWPDLGVPGFYELEFTDTGSGWVEKCLFMVPDLDTPAEVPLLVVFHKFSTSHWDVHQNTHYLSEAASRGWYLLAPLGATDINYSSLDSQVNTEFVIHWAVKRFNIERRRLYAVGFSMGGGNALNYAARHLDFKRGMFAGIVNHTGGPSQHDTYLNDATAGPYMDILFGGPPAENLFAYQRASVIDIDPIDGTVVPGADLARNLTHIGMKTYYAVNDPKVYLRTQCDKLHAHLLGLGADHELVIKPGAQHSWSTINETAVCEFLDRQEIEDFPISGSTLADRDGVYFHLEVVQDAPGAFTPFDWEAEAAANRFRLTGTANLQQLVVRTAKNGLDTAQPLELVLETADGLPDEVILTGYDQAPSAVDRDGQPEVGWVWDPLLKRLHIVESDGGPHTWLITP